MIVLRRERSRGSPRGFRVFTMLGWRPLKLDAAVAWLRENGGFCDCEVIYNVDEKFGALVGR
jgi:hypothetical protein